MPPIKAVAFDIDGTLYPQWKLITSSLAFYLKNFSLVQRYWKVRCHLRRDDYFYEAQGRSGLHSHQASMCANLTGEDTIVVERLLEQKIYNEWEILFQRISPFTRVRPVLETLKQRGFKIAAMSDFPVEKKLRYFNLEPEMWDLAITSEDSGYLKPHKAPYEYLCNQLNLRPEEILYVGNSYRNDIEGAKQAGYWAAYFSYYDKKNSLADFRFSNYKNFISLYDTFLERIGHVE